MFYRLFGWWFRWQACKIASVAMGAWKPDSDNGICPMLWSATVFFESYMVHGSEWTHEDFGPKEPVELSSIDTQGLKAAK